MGVVPAVTQDGPEQWERPLPQGLGERAADGTVVELLPSLLVRVRLEGEHQLIAHLASSQRTNFVRLRVGDRVRVAISAADRTRGRILELLTKGQSV